MRILLFALPGVAAAVLSWLLTPMARRVAVGVGAVDRPAARKIHVMPTPRLGGLAVVASAVAVLAVIGLTTRLLHRESLWLGVGLGLVPVLLVSIADDIRRVSAGWKFLGHLAGATIAVSLGVTLAPVIHLFGHTIDIGWWAFPVSVLWLVGVTNAFNLVDGLDGLSAGLALISAGGLIAVFVIAHQTGMAIAALVLAGAIVGFLPYNFHPASIFLGDTGATAIGFCLASLALRGGSTTPAGFATLLPVIALGVPIAETLISMLRRALGAAIRHDAARIFTADRAHLHHRLLDLGLGHRRAVLTLYGAGVCFAGVGLLSVLMTAQEAGLLLLGLLLAAFVGVGRLGYEEFGIIRSGIVLRFYDAPVLKRSVFIVFLDIVFVALSVYVAVGLRTDDWGLLSNRSLAVTMAALLVPSTVVVLWLFRVYRGSWRLASVYDVFRLNAAVAGSALLGFFLSRAILSYDIPLSVFVLFGLVKVAIGTGSRLSYRMFVVLGGRAGIKGLPTLIYGAGEGGVAALREMLTNADVGLRPVGFIDDNPDRAGRAVNGVPIVGGLEDLERAIGSAGVRTVVVASRKVPEERIALARATCERHGVKLVRMEIRFEECGAEAARVVARGLGEPAA